METNERVVESNSLMIDQTIAWLESSPLASATEQANEELAARNIELTGKLKSLASENDGKVQMLLKSTQANRDSILEDSKIIFERCKMIEGNRDQIQENMEQIANFIDGYSVGK